ncbi:MAG TPA: hypothetical protein VFT22_41725 [Kofleriaceae bacterium]|nr:hypothetical protein [Kofleriaceae bacterium]
MRLPDAAIASVAALLLAPVLFPLGAVLLMSLAVLLVPVIPVVALVGLATLLVLVARSKHPATDSALQGPRGRSPIPAAPAASCAS